MADIDARQAAAATTTVAWYPRSAAAGDIHRGARRPTGRITALGGPPQDLPNTQDEIPAGRVTNTGRRTPGAETAPSG